MQNNNIMVFEDKKPVVGKGVWIDPTARIIGDVEIGQDSSIWPYVICRGDVNSIRIGARTNIQDGSIIHVSGDSLISPGGYPTIVGDDVTVGHGAMLHGCVIEDATLIGMRATLLDGSRVEKHGVLGAGALLAPGKVVRSGEVWMGTPARKVRILSDSEIEHLYVSAQQYSLLKDRFLKALKG